jgi:hypothetical protein
MPELLRRGDGWVFAAEDARRLGAVRIGLCTVLALRLAVTNYGAAAQTPAALFHPLTYMKLFERMPSPELVGALRTCGIVAAVFAAAGLALRASLPVALVCSLILDGMLNSTGRVIVGDAVLMLCLIVLLASGSAAGEAWSPREPLRRVLLGHGRASPAPEPSAVATRGARAVRYGWPIRTAMLVVTLAYFFAGVQKWRYSGLAWVTSDNLRWILYGQAHPNDLALYVADRPTLAHVLAAGALLLETCFPLILFFPRLRWLFIPSVVAMHVGIRLAIRLDYSAQWLALVVVFVNWPAVVDRLRSATAVAPALREAAR